MSDNFELISYFQDHKDKKGIPTLNKQEWKQLNTRYDKEAIIKALIDYIRLYKPEPPVCNITYDDMRRCFFKLKNKSWTDFFLDHETIKDQVLEKYDDYSFPYKYNGLGVIQLGNSYLDVSNYFNQELRMNCDSYGYKSPHYRWKTATDLVPVMQALWRLGNDHLDESAFVVAFRLSSYIATQFKPHVAKTIYDMTQAKDVLDMSMGWGDRLAAFYCSDTTRSYVGCDPSDVTFPMYIKQCIEYEKLITGQEPNVMDFSAKYGRVIIEGKKKVELFNMAAEDLLLPLNEFDLAFTSPPYFSTELYNLGGEHENEQSWSRYKTYEDWRDKFLLPVNTHIMKVLRPGGYNFVNIMDPKIKNTRYYASDDLGRHIMGLSNSYRFIGQLGMRIKQRPRNISDTEQKEHFKKLYIEPIWVFGKKTNSLKMAQTGLNQYF
jgi:hypothetical protein